MVDSVSNGLGLGLGSQRHLIFPFCYAPINVKPRVGVGCGSGYFHGVLTYVCLRSVPRVGILIVQDILRVGNLT